MITLGKIVLGVLSCAPLIFFAVFFLWLIPAFFQQTSSGSQPSLYAQRFDTLLPFAMVTSALLIGLLALYSIILAKRQDLQLGEKIGVPVLILATNGIVLPLIFRWYIWRRLNLAALSRHTPSG